MELTALILALLALPLSIISIVITVWNTIHIQAQRLSTHSVIPISPGNTTLDNIEEQLGKIAKGSGADQGDLNRNLFHAGVDVEDLV